MTTIIRRGPGTRHRCALPDADRYDLQSVIECNACHKQWLCVKEFNDYQEAHRWRRKWFRVAATAEPTPASRDTPPPPPLPTPEEIRTRVLNPNPTMDETQIIRLPQRDE